MFLYQVYICVSLTRGMYNKKCKHHLLKDISNVFAISTYSSSQYYQVRGVLGKSFRCEAGPSSRKIISENITIGIGKPITFVTHEMA